LACLQISRAPVNRCTYFLESVQAEFLLKLPLLVARMRVSVVAGISGCELVALDADPSWQRQDVLATVPKQAHGHHCQRNIFLGEVELRGPKTLADIGATSSVALTLLLTPLIVATASEDGTAKLWSASSGGSLRTLQGHTGSVYSAVFSPDGQEVLTASEDGTAKLWSGSSGECLRALQGHTGIVYSAVFSPDGQEVLTASEDGTAKLWSASSGECLCTLQELFYSAVFSPDGQEVLTCSGDGTAKLWSVPSGECLRTLQGHTDAVKSAVFSRLN